MRLIDAEKLCAELEIWKQGKTDTNSYDLVNHFQGIIRTAPTVEERKHGHWVWDNDEKVWKCSNCESGDDFLISKYCKDCGAIMDEVNEDEEI